MLTNAEQHWLKHGGPRPDDADARYHAHQMSQLRALHMQELRNIKARLDDAVAALAIAHRSADNPERVTKALDAALRRLDGIDNIITCAENRFSLTLE